MFDKLQRLIVYNEAYTKIYGYSADDTKPGTSFQSFLPKKRALGLDLRDQRGQVIDLDVGINANIGRLAACRMDATSKVNQQQTLENGGWVSTHGTLPAASPHSARESIARAHKDGTSGWCSRRSWKQSAAHRRQSRMISTTCLLVIIGNLDLLKDTTSAGAPR